MRAGFYLLQVRGSDDIRSPASLTIQGADTSSTTLCAVFFYLSRYPACYDRLASEIRQTFLSTSEIRSGHKLNHCNYLRASIDEAMRLTPPSGGILWREVCTEALLVDNQSIPGGYDVGCSIYTIHHNKEYFPDPHAFKPERWIPSAENPKEDIAKARLAFHPFSIGPRACAGKTMAYMQVSDIIAKTIWYMDFRRPEGPLGLVGEGVKGDRNGRNRVDEFQVQDHITSSHDGPFLEFRCREGFSEEILGDEVA